MHLSIRFGTILALMYWLSSCISDAPRINPLDPAFTVNQKIRIQGKVTRFNTTTGIANAQISIGSGEVFTRSDANGNYTLEANLADGSYLLRCNAPGYAADSTQINLQAETAAQQNFLLNGLPELESISLTTRHLGSFIPPDAFFIDLLVTVDDVDGLSDIDLVWCEIPDLQFSDTLQIIQQSQQYFARLTTRQLDVSALEALQGTPFFVYVRDMQGDVTMSDARFISRIIDTAPVTTSPTGLTGQPVQFQWQAFAQPYSFIYRIEVYPNVNIALPPVATINSIPSDETTIQLSTTLTAGEYYWVLYAVDAFGNYSRSVQTALIIGSAPSTSPTNNGLIE
ncbi:MAG: carboxypeptidase regulatory-like domain-containing protein [Calditrichae bacterium]|nr:carboxypeptidase regulatory-like domain-containing protein [Calditrichia bacterium]